MWYIPVLLKICDVEVNYITQFYPFNIVWCKVGADGGHVHMYFFSFSNHFGFFFTF